MAMIQKTEKTRFFFLNLKIFGKNLNFPLKILNFRAKMPYFFRSSGGGVIETPSTLDRVVRSVSLEQHEDPDRVEKFVRYVARCQYKVRTIRDSDLRPGQKHTVSNMIQWS